MELGITNKHDNITNIPRENQGVGGENYIFTYNICLGGRWSQAFEVAEGVLHGSRTYLLQSPDGHLEWTIELIFVVYKSDGRWRWQWDVGVDCDGIFCMYICIYHTYYIYICMYIMYSIVMIHVYKYIFSWKRNSEQNLSTYHVFECIWKLLV